MHQLHERRALVSSPPMGEQPQTEKSGLLDGYPAALSDRHPPMSWPSFGKKVSICLGNPLPLDGRSRRLGENGMELE